MDESFITDGQPKRYFDRTWYKLGVCVSRDGAQATTAAQRRLCRAIKEALSSGKGTPEHRTHLANLHRRESRTRICSPKAYRFTVYHDEYDALSTALRNFTDELTCDYVWFMSRCRHPDTRKV